MKSFYRCNLTSGSQYKTLIKRKIWFVVSEVPHAKDIWHYSLSKWQLTRQRITSIPLVALPETVAKVLTCDLDSSKSFHPLRSVCSCSSDSSFLLYLPFRPNLISRSLPSSLETKLC